MPSGIGGKDRPNKKGNASPVNFIGKLVWAKGFDQMLDPQGIFRKRHGACPMGVYSSGTNKNGDCVRLLPWMASLVANGGAIPRSKDCL